MLALIMAGGKGSRLGMGEKPLVTICGKPMISYVIDAFTDFGCEPVVVASPQTPMTKNWCRTRGIAYYSAQGAGYVEDIIEVVSALEEKSPLFTCVSDVPCLTREILATIHAAYLDSGSDACSVWVPFQICREYHCTPRHVETCEQTRVCPAGINILRGDRIEEEQDELRLILPFSRLVFNVNTREERDSVQRYLCRRNGLD